MEGHGNCNILLSLDITEIRPHLSEVIGRGGDPEFPLHIDKLSTSSHPHMYKPAIYTKFQAYRKPHRQDTRKSLLE
jgi:hypothetical protein